MALRDPDCGSTTPRHAVAADDQPSRGASRPNAPAAKPRKWPRRCKESWPDHPEWVDMLTAILQDEPMSPTYGWFRTAVTQTRFDWDATRKRYDRDGDGKIARGEFPGSDADFARLDRDHDKALTAADFDFSASALRRRPARCSSACRPRRQRQDHARGTRRILQGRRQRRPGLPVALRPAGGVQPAAGVGLGLRPAQAGPRRPRSSAASSARRSARSSPGPRLDESAPDFTLKTNDGKAEITLSKLVGPKPVVLIFGSFTCGPFRSQSGNIEKLYRRYKDRATFVMVYVREAHPTDGWRMESNDRVGAVTAAADDLRRTRRGRPEMRPAARTSVSRCSSTRSTTPSARATAACRAVST